MEEEIKKIVREEIAAATHASDDETILDARQAAEFLRVKRPTIYDLKARGKIPFRKIGGKVVFLKKELFDWVKSGKSGD